MVEHRLAKARVASSSLVSRSIPHHPGRIDEVQGGVGRFRSQSPAQGAVPKW